MARVRYAWKGSWRLQQLPVMRHLLPLVCALIGATTWAAVVCAADKVDVDVRGKMLTLAIGHPAGQSRGTIIMGSGDVGWVGLAVSMADTLSAQGYTVVGINVRQYLSTFTSGKSHLLVSDIPGDYRLIRDELKQRRLLTHPVLSTRWAVNSAYRVQEIA